MMKARSHSFLLPLYCTIFATLLLLGRFLFLPVKRTYFFLEWNLLLAWIPFLLTYYLLQKNLLKEWKKHFLLCGFLIFLWFIFFPNTLYIITDFIHLKFVTDHSLLWLDFLLIGSFAWTGMILGFYSLKVIQNFIDTAWGKMPSYLFVFAMMFLSSFGIYLGRVLRWNSWDIILSPVGLATDVWTMIIHPLAYHRAWLFCLGFGLLLLAGYGIFLWVHQKENLQQEKSVEVL